MAGPENLQGICVPPALVAEIPQVLASCGAKVEVVELSDAERAAARLSVFRCISPMGFVVNVSLQRHRVACGDGTLVIFYPQWKGRGGPGEEQFLANLVGVVRQRGAYEMARRRRDKRA